LIAITVDRGKPAQPEFTLEDTGSLNNDGITNNGVITINNLEVGVTWQYSVNGGNDFIDGTGSSFTLANNTTYEANAIQIRQTDMAGNVSAMKSLPPLTEYCQVTPTSKLLIVITPLLVMPSLFNEPVSSKENAGYLK
jgi:hypothetical protein